LFRKVFGDEPKRNAGNNTNDRKIREGTNNLRKSIPNYLAV
jgi:hypothetical protein